MQVTNRRLMTCPFEEYLKLPGWSYSGLKNEGKEWAAPTEKMVLGTRVHSYLLTPEEYKHEDAAIVKPLAVALKARIGPLITLLKPELAVLATFAHAGFEIQYKGRGDLVIPGKLVIDIKVTEMPLHKGIEFFGWDKQVSGYAMGFGAQVALLIGINPKNLLITLYNASIQSGWWEHKIKSKGEPVL